MIRKHCTYWEPPIKQIWSLLIVSCVFLIFKIHLMLELPAQLPASNYNNFYSNKHLLNWINWVSITQYIVASELKDPICHSDRCQIGSFSSEATIWSFNRYPSASSAVYMFNPCAVVQFQTSFKGNRKLVLNLVNHFPAEHDYCLFNLFY